MSTSAIATKELIAQAIAGSDSARRDLKEKCTGALISRFDRLFDDLATAERLAEETWPTILRNLPNCKASSADEFRKWALKIATPSAISVLYPIYNPEFTRRLRCRVHPQNIPDLLTESWITIAQELAGDKVPSANELEGRLFKCVDRVRSRIQAAEKRRRRKTIPLPESGVKTTSEPDAALLERELDQRVHCVLVSAGYRDWEIQAWYHKQAGLSNEEIGQLVNRHELTVHRSIEKMKETILPIINQ